MFGLWKRKKAKDWTYYTSRFNSLAKEHIPPSGEASTKQGELVRCISNLTDESERNGNANWDELNEQEIDFLRSNLPDRSIFDLATCAQIASDLDSVAKAGRSGHDSSEEFEDHFMVETKIFNRLMMRVVDWCDAHPELIELNPRDPNIRRFEKEDEEDSDEL